MAEQDSPKELVSFDSRDVEAPPQPQQNDAAQRRVSLTSRPTYKLTRQPSDLLRLDAILEHQGDESLDGMRARFLARFDAFNRADGTAGATEVAEMLDIDLFVARMILKKYFENKEIISKDDLERGIERIYNAQPRQVVLEIVKDGQVAPEVHAEFEQFLKDIETMNTTSKNAERRNTKDAIFLGELFNRTMKRLIEREAVLTKVEIKWTRWQKYRHYIHKYRVELFWMILLTLITIGCFIYRFLIYYFERPYAYDVMGLCICFARGSALAINFLMVIVFITVCRSVWTWIQSRNDSAVKRMIPVNRVLDAHRVAGLAILFFALIHIGAHICDFQRIGEATADQLSLAFEQNITQPLSTQYMWTQSIPGTTGIAMACIFAVAYPFTLHFARKKEHFNVFWFTHNLFIVFSILLIVHGTAQLLDSFASLWFIIVPLGLYMIDRFYRLSGSLLGSTKSEVTSLTLLSSGRIVRLECKKPTGLISRLRGAPKAHARWDQFLPGAYAFMNAPEIGYFEWHPFSISSAPQDDLLTFHVQAVGDWTNALKDSIGKVKYVYLDGPFGAPSQSYCNFTVAVLIAGGVGITPYASILSSLRDPKRRFRLKKVILVWIVKNPDDLEVMNDVLGGILQECKHLVEIVRFVTDKSLKKRLDAQPGLLTVYGKRPDLDLVFRSAMATARQFENKSGVFFTGNRGLGDNIQSICQTLSRTSKERFGEQFDFAFHREIF